MELYASVIERFLLELPGWEGPVRHLYLDSEGNMTIGYGLLLHSPADALGLGLVFPLDSTRRVELADIQRDWNAITTRGARGAAAAASVTLLRLTPAGLISSARNKISAVVRALRNRGFRDIGVWPADAQLGVLIMAWGLGVDRLSREYTPFKEACAAQDWERAAREAHWHTDRRDDGGRQVALGVCFRNADAVQKRGYLPSHLFFREELPPASAPDPLAGLT